MIRTLGNKLGVSGDHVISPPVHTSVVQILRVLADNIKMRLMELQEHNAAVGRGDAGVSSASIDAERDDIVRESIEMTYAALSKVVSMLLEDARSLGMQRAKQETILPFETVIKRRDELDQKHLEQYLSNDDCIKYLGHSKAALATMPPWQLEHVKRRANLLK
eukprot:jgi/Hompol1/2494/HPOL_002929-RA